LGTVGDLSGGEESRAYFYIMLLCIIIEHKNILVYKYVSIRLHVFTPVSFHKVHFSLVPV